MAEYREWCGLPHAMPEELIAELVTLCRRVEALTAALEAIAKHPRACVDWIGAHDRDGAFAGVPVERHVARAALALADTTAPDAGASVGET